MSDKDLYLGKYEHGRPSTYNRGCRCIACRATSPARRARSKERFQSGEVQITHGRNGYVYWGCRCATCTDANTAETYAPGRVWEVGHPEEGRENSRRKWKGEQEKTLNVATRNRHEWTGPELELASRTDLTARELALLLGRTYAAVKTMRYKLKADPKTISLAGIAKRAGDPR